MKYKVRVVADMEFEIESYDEHSINGDATRFVEDNKDLFDWEFDYYKEVENEHLELVYEDDGVGIPEPEKEKIFLEGYGKGTGYGLYLIRQMCKVYGWTIKETSKQGGAQLTMTIPSMNENSKMNYQLH